MTMTMNARTGPVVSGRGRTQRVAGLGKLLARTSLAAALACAAAGHATAQEWKAHSVPLFLGTGNDGGYQGFVRVINRSGVSGEVLVEGFDLWGVLHGPATLDIGANETVHFNARDLEDGNAGKGLSGGIGEGEEGEWRLRLRSRLDLEVLAYNRTRDGLLAPMHDLVRRAEVRRPGAGAESMGHRVVIFNPASNVNQTSHLFINNPGGEAAAVTVEGIDDEGESPGGAVGLTVPGRRGVGWSAKWLEAGAEGLFGRLGDGRGKWRLVVTSDRPVEVMSLMLSPTGHLVNLSTETEAGAGGVASEHSVPLFAAADNANGYQGFVRVINRTDASGEVTVWAIDDAGTFYDAGTFDIGANAAVHFNSSDLEDGNPGKGLMEGIGEGVGDWRLVLTSNVFVQVLAYNRTDDGLLAPLHDLAPYTTVVRPGGEEAAEHHVATFNPASNVNQVSRLRIINTGGAPAYTINQGGGAPAFVTIEGVDDAGASPGGAVTLVVAPWASRTLTAKELESGDAKGLAGRLGDGRGKWRLAVTSEQSIRVMSLLSSPTGHLVNLSTAAPAGVPVPAPPSDACDASASAVDIPDPNLRAAVARALGKPGGKPISPTEMASLGALSVEDGSVRNLTGLECARALEELRLGGNRISSIGPLSGLTSLTVLHLEENLISNIGLLSGLTSLEELRLAQNQISNIGPLSGLTSLKSLGLRLNPISDIGPLSGLTSLEWLDLDNTLPSNIGPLSGLTSLEELHLAQNQISNIGPLSGLTSLKALARISHQGG